MAKEMFFNGTFNTFFFFLLLLLRHPSSCNAVNLKPCGFNKIYNFGDSITDTGNAKVEFPGDEGWGFPLGVTIGNDVTGRFCDGLLIIDRIAQSAGLPFANPYLNKSLEHIKGVNFAVGGTGFLSKELREKWHVTLKYSQSSLDVQLRWFDEHLATTFKDEAGTRREHIKSSLFVIGGGSNDYVNLHGPPGLGVVVERKLMMPDMMKCLTDAIKKFISYGATRIVVIGLPQGGCWPGNSQPDNKLHCDPVANEYHAIHNLLVQNEIQQLNKDFPDVLVAYGDIWGSSQWVWDRYKSLGFSFPQKSCCGSWELPCGFKGAPYCGKPKEYVHWDSTGHFTDAAYRYMSKQMIPRIYSGFKCSATRPTAKIEL
ncbi:GDSL esterase/lipase At3g48460 [Linum perenne]